ncbi:MAG: DUF1854 domain-containing protein [bacterium]
MCYKEKSKDDLLTLDPEKLELFFTQGEILKIKIEDGQEYENVEINPAFPLSEVGKYLIFLDQEGNEIGILKDINNLSIDSQDVVKRILDKIYFMPEITKIYSIEEEFGVSRWEVETSKGHRVFDIRSRRRDVRPFGPKRIIIHDVDGNRYEITDYTQLDQESQKILSSEI